MQAAQTLDPVRVEADRIPVPEPDRSATTSERSPVLPRCRRTCPHRGGRRGGGGGVEPAARGRDPEDRGPEGQQQNPNYRGTLTQFTDISPGYFETMRIPVRGGGTFRVRPRGSTTVAIVNRRSPGISGPARTPRQRFAVVQNPMRTRSSGPWRRASRTDRGDAAADDLPASRARVCSRDGARRPVGAEPAPAVANVRDQVQTLDRNMPPAIPAR